LSKKDVRFIIERSLQRLGQERLNLVQFHWWDFSKGDYIAAAQYLEDLRREGLIEDLGLTNFDCPHTEKLIKAGIKVSSNQIQFSLLDPRPFNGMLDLGQKHNIDIFCYGVLAGGLLGYKNPLFDPTNRSHVKYKLMIDEASHDYYDQVIDDLSSLADKYKTTVANIATQFVLETKGVSAVVLGPRNTQHLKEMAGLFKFELTSEDYKKLQERMKKDLSYIHDDIYSYERDLNGPHGRIMKYNLNNMRPHQD
jgi:aryl-alcohol dehydrogenase-like predicted oxidoreductase